MGKYDGIKDEWDKLKDKKEQWDDLINIIPEYDPPPDHLWNIPDTDIWITPGEPVEPGDCEKWPASCDRIFDPLHPANNNNLSPGLDFESSYSNCSICITITPNLGPISFPPYTICRIKPECEEPEEELPPSPNVAVPDLPFGNYPELYEYPVRDFDWYLTSDGGSGSFVSRPEGCNGFYIGGGYFWPYIAQSNGGTIYDGGISSSMRIGAGERLILVAGYGTESTPSMGLNSVTYYFYKIPPGKDGDYIRNPLLYQVNFEWDVPGRTHYFYRPIVEAGTAIKHWPGYDQSAFPDCFQQWTWNVRLSEYGTPRYAPAPPISTPTPIPTPDPQIMPNCCDLEPIQKLLLKQQKQLKRLEKVIAPEEFYEIKSDGSVGDNIAKIPKRFMYPLATGEEAVTSIPKMLEFAMRHIDRNFGTVSWEAVIRDSDPNTPGDQTLPIQVHSVSDGLKAIFQFLIDQASTPKKPDDVLENVLANQRALIHLAYDLASTKKLAFHNNCYLQNIEDFLDYKVEQKKETVSFAIDPEINGFHDRLSNLSTMKKLFTVKNHKIVVTDNVERVNLTENLAQISRNAAIAASPHVHVYKSGIIDKLVDAAQLGTELTNTALIMDLKRNLGIMTPDEMKEWRSDAEKAYIPSGGNIEDSIEVGNREEKYYGHRKPARIQDSTKRSRRRNRRRQ